MLRFHHEVCLVVTKNPFFDGGKKRHREAHD
jgi:hypothetical protein